MIQARAGVNNDSETNRNISMQQLVDFSLNEQETKQFPFELVYPLFCVKYNCTTSQGN